MKRICIDARLWGVGHTGPGRYTQNLVNHLPVSQGYEVVLIINKEQKFDPELKKFKTYISLFHPYSLLSQIEMPLLLMKIRPHLHHSTHFTIPLLWPGKMVVTIHDLIKHYSRGAATTTRHPFLYWIKYAGYLLTVWAAVHCAKHIIVPSKYWKDALQKKYKIKPERISVTYEAVADSFLNTRASTYDPGIKTPFIVHTGNLYPHKNIPVLVKAVNSLKGRVRVAFICSRSVFAQRLPESPWAVYLGRLTDSDLLAVYAKATAYVFPSLIEGFGLPGLEAMAVGLPVIASNSSCLPEIYEDAAMYFDPRDPHELAQKIELMITDKEVRSDLIKKGKNQVKKYSWNNMAKQTWEIYQNALQ